METSAGGVCFACKVAQNELPELCPAPHRDVNKGPIKSGAALRPRPSAGSGAGREERQLRDRPSHVGRAGAGPGSLPPPRRGDREPAVPGAPGMAHRGGEPNAECQGVSGGGRSPPS